MIPCDRMGLLLIEQEAPSMESCKKKQQERLIQSETQGFTGSTVRVQPLNLLPQFPLMDSCERPTHFWYRKKRAEVNQQLPNDHDHKLGVTRA